MNTQPTHWTRLHRDVVYDTFLRVVRDRVRLPDGTEIDYDSIDQGDCACVLILTSTHQIVLLRQYRYLLDEVTWEIPMGGVRPSETPEEAARREVHEETGYGLGHLILLGTIVPSNGQSPQRMYLFFGRAISLGPAAPDSTEFLEVQHLDSADVKRLVDSGSITDAATVTAILLAERRGLL